jgi:DUF1680 family protein
MNAEKTFPKQEDSLKRVPFTNVQIADTFWLPRLRAHKDVTLKACLDKCEQTGRIANFVKAAGKMPGAFEGIYFNDSDVYKVLEGIAYALATNADPALEARADEIIAKIAAAQEPDGYLDTYFTLAAPEKKWTDMEKHEDYCAGHLFEAAVAYYQVTGKRQFLDVACKLADHLDTVLGPGKKHWVVGHEEPELALVKLYHATGEKRYLNLAIWMLEERGHGHGRGMIWDKPGWGPAYCQDDKPVREMTDIAGHAVRAMYLYTGMADVAAVTRDAGYINALKHLWESVVLRNMYVTGGIGSSKSNEGFTADYDLPNESAYCETCAAVGLVYWNHRLNLMTSESRYADIVERAMYNGALAGVSLTGERFFYVNPLESKGAHHRQEWFDCSCCPTQIARFIPSIGDYVYAVSAKGIWVNLYLAGRAMIPYNEQEVKLRQTTNYPWEGNVALTIETAPAEAFALSLRIPGWCQQVSVQLNGQPLEQMIFEQGYLQLNRQWQNGDTITLNFVMPVERIYAHSKVMENAGQVALQRGPLVYCVEEVDNPTNFDALCLPEDATFFIRHRPDLLDGVTVIEARFPDGKGQMTAIPYYVWDNRTPGKMRVWLPERRQQANEYLYSRNR